MSSGGAAMVMAGIGIASRATVRSNGTLSVPKKLRTIREKTNERPSAGVASSSARRILSRPSPAGRVGAPPVPIWLVQGYEPSAQVGFQGRHFFCPSFAPSSGIARNISVALP